jgi:hypothetical protein
MEDHDIDDHDLMLQFRKDLADLQQIVTHLIKRVKREIIDGVVPEGQTSLLEKHDPAILTQKLTNMATKLFNTQVRVSVGIDTGSFSYVTDRIQVLRKAVKAMGSNPGWRNVKSPSERAAEMNPA